ncbi:MAG: hypothetical protein JSR55_00210 [Proteobacteria bacterium]|nr:hypothetical protein [Pseudomonadota bacterium]
MQVRIFFAALAAVLALGNAAEASSLNKKTEADIGRGISIALPVAAYSIAYLHHEDWTGMKELTAVTMLTVGSAFLAHEFIKRRSPDGSTDRSFPSMEAALSAPSSGYLWQRYGWQYGLPALVLSQGANLLLDDAGKHRIWDGFAVTAAAAVLNWGITTPYHESWSYGACVNRDGAFVTVGMAL